MDKKLKAKWVKALRSGRYKQCRYTIQDGKSYCCLGVLSRVMNPRAPVSEIDYPSDDVVMPGDKRRLANMNDGFAGERNHSFAEIADYIEAKL